VVGDEYGAPGMADDRLGDADLAVVEIQQRAVGVDGGCAHDGEIHLELADQIDGGLAHDAAVGGPHHAAGDDDFRGRGLTQDVGDVEVVGDRHDAAVLAQGDRDLFGRGADVQHDGGIVGDERRRRRADARLCLGRQHPA
jgi:hypothetical protein